MKIILSILIISLFGHGTDVGDPQTLIYFSDCTGDYLVQLDNENIWNIKPYYVENHCALEGFSNGDKVNAEVEAYDKSRPISCKSKIICSRIAPESIRVYINHISAID